MSERTNADRALDAKKALIAHLGSAPMDDPPTDDIIDLVTNLMHYAASQDIDFNEVTRMAKVHFEVEVYES
jgi:hypothetical protein